jgi:hypothetical protein
MFIAMIDLSRTSDSTTILICNALVMFMIHPWIKIKLKVLIFPTIRKSYCRNFSFMARFVDALKPVPFTGANFKRWQMRVTLWLTAMNVFWVSEGKPIQKPTQSIVVLWLENLQRVCKIRTSAINC